ncbi:MAG: 3-dehydroquinate dehydratase [Arachnia propionica]|nr:MAG: 3-dehydroquinate dehydratase [Arachnia propionica]
MKKVLVLNGPNLGRLGMRQPEIYGHTTYAQLEQRLIDLGAELGLAVEVRQTDHEGEMVGWLGEAADLGLPVVLNPGAWSHYSIAVADAVAQVSVVIEVHLSNVHAREQFRQHLVVSPYATAVITGLGIGGYESALRHLAAGE